MQIICINPSRPQPSPPPSNSLLQPGDKNRWKVLFRESDHTLPHPTLWFLFKCQRQWRFTSEKRVAGSQRLETGKVYWKKKNILLFVNITKSFINSWVLQMIIILRVWLQEWSKDVRLARVEFFSAATLSVRPSSKLAVCWQCASKTAGKMRWQLQNGTIATSSKISLLYNICQDSGVGSDCGRGDLHNVIFNSSVIRYVFVSIFVITKGPTPFTLLSQSPSYHYHSWWKQREDSFPPTSTVFLIFPLMTSDWRLLPLCPNMLDCQFDRSDSKTQWAEGWPFVPD